VWQDKERVASARFGSTTQNSFPSRSARVVHSKSSFLTSHRRVAPKAIRRALQQPEHDKELVFNHLEPMQSYRPAQSTRRVARASPSPVGQSSSRFRRARCARAPRRRGAAPSEGLAGSVRPWPPGSLAPGPSERRGDLRAGHAPSELPRCRPRIAWAVDRAWRFGQPVRGLRSARSAGQRRPPTSWWRGSRRPDDERPGRSRASITSPLPEARCRVGRPCAPREGRDAVQPGGWQRIHHQQPVGIGGRAPARETRPDITDDEVGTRSPPAAACRGSLQRDRTTARIGLVSRPA